MEGVGTRGEGPGVLWQEMWGFVQLALGTDIVQFERGRGRP